MRYKILEGHSVDELSELVNNEIADGWEPLGPPSYCYSLKYERVLIQAMIKHIIKRL